MKLNSHAREALGDVIELMREGHNAGQIAKKVGKSRSFIDRMMKNLPKLIGQMLDEEPA